MKNTDTKEWAGKNVNIQTGCEHGCRYCYARHNAIVRFGRCTAKEWANPVIDPSKVLKNYRRTDKILMFPSSHDITPRNIIACETVLKKILYTKNHVLIVSKPHLECIERLCESLKYYGKHRAEFRFSITSANHDTLAFWEPMAPTYWERLECLKIAHAAGYKTSVSIEPVLDPDVRTIMEAVVPYVTEGVWIGKVNDLDQRLNLAGANPEKVARYVEIVKTLAFPAWMDRIRRQADGFESIVKWKNSMR